MDEYPGLVNDTRTLSDGTIWLFFNYTEAALPGMRDCYKAYHGFEEYIQTAIPITGTFTKTMMFDTIQSLGGGHFYTACDGIPRFRFNSTFTSTRTSTMVVEKLKSNKGKFVDQRYGGGCPRPDKEA
jgi:hypothetical protein